MYKIKAMHLMLDHIGQFKKGELVEKEKIKKYCNFETLLKENQIESVNQDHLDEEPQDDPQDDSQKEQVPPKQMEMEMQNEEHMETQPRKLKKSKKVESYADIEDEAL